MKNISIFHKLNVSLCRRDIHGFWGVPYGSPPTGESNQFKFWGLYNSRNWKWIVSEFLQAKRGSSPPGWLLQWKKSSMQVNLDMFYLQGLVLRWAFIHKEAQIGPSYISFYLFRHPEVQTYWMILLEENLRRKWQKW